VTAWAWLSYVALALVTNTAVGPPFDPVLVWFAAGRPRPEMWALAVAGSVCAGLAGVLEASIGHRFVPAGRIPARARRLTRGRTFYAFAAAVSASPLPFTLVRVAALARKPHPLAYGAAVAAGRLPPYALTVLAWNHLGLPGGHANGQAGAVGFVQAGRRVMRRDRGAELGPDPVRLAC
jgi:hypothetical protein